MCVSKINIRRLSIALTIFVLFMLICVDVFAADYPDKLIPGGRTTGIKLYADGAVVTGFSSEKSPARSAGLKIGDVIVSVDGQDITDKNTLTGALSSGNDKDFELEIIRKGQEMKVNVVADFDAAKGAYSIGASVKDSIAGIGTVTYIVPDSGEYGALGHGITDPDTMSLMPFDEGVLMQSTVTSVKKGEQGAPGELIGAYEMSRVQGTVDSNTNCGIFGKLKDYDGFCPNTQIPIADDTEVKNGKAYILSNINSDCVEQYDIEIVDIDRNNGELKQMLIRVTDEDLLNATGGIVQGMSGSPIIQDGKLVGAVTHVLVNDPTRGYGIFIENMLEAAK